jgi:hypothetical protein
MRLYLTIHSFSQVHSNNFSGENSNLTYFGNFGWHGNFFSTLGFRVKRQMPEQRLRSRASAGRVGALGTVYTPCSRVYTRVHTAVLTTTAVPVLVVLDYRGSPTGYRYLCIQL